jgi:hypothetical protein
VNTHNCLQEWRCEQRISPPGDNFTPRGLIHTWGTTSPLWSKFAPRSEVKNGPQGTVRKPPKKKIETMNLPFYELSMNDGTICDLVSKKTTLPLSYSSSPDMYIVLFVVDDVYLD